MNNTKDNRALQSLSTTTKDRQMITAGIRRLTDSDRKDIREANREQLKKAARSLNYITSRVSLLLDKTIPDRLKSAAKRSKMEARGQLRRSERKYNPKSKTEKLVIPESIRKLFGG